jgi:molybdate transport system ATP-binding protein
MNEITEKILRLANITVNLFGQTCLTDINVEIFRSQQWAIVGPSGSGKTTLARAISGKLFYQGSIEYHFPGNGKIVMIEQLHHFKDRSNKGDFYYQQRFNSCDSENTINVRDAILTFTGENELGGEAGELIRILHLEDLLDKPIIQLSNGEHKRLQLAESLALAPALLIADNPFTGLDPEGRKTLKEVLANITRSGILLILITDPAEFPACITHVLSLSKGRSIFCGPIEEYQAPDRGVQAQTEFDGALLTKIDFADTGFFDIAIRMVHVNIRYGENRILRDIDWEVRKGTCWSISGPNGAGKSTLLSLVTGDNPQAYANEIWLFDRRRGTGESIWEIKKHIGHVSPEMHLYFDQSGTCSEVVASGLFDTIGLFRRLSDPDTEKVMCWLKIMNLESLTSRPFSQVSPSQQRMLLLARAMVKNPPVLILDEPCQGLDQSQILFFNSLIDAYWSRFHPTVLYVTHYSHQLPACIQYFLKLENGSRIHHGK